MISKELAKKIRLIQIATRKAVTSVFAGEYNSAFKGQGMEFEEVREYFPGDEIRTIDWNVTARTGKPHVKRFREERELTVLLAVDLSASGSFGGADKLKNEIAAEVSAILSFSAIKNNDKVGLIIFTDEIEMFIPPKKGSTHVLRIVRELLTFKPGRKKTSIKNALEFLGKITSRKAVCFLISDFIDSGYNNIMRTMARRHDFVGISITDPREIELPSVGMITLEDAETGELVLLDTSDAGVRRAYKAQGLRRYDELRRQFLKMGIDHVQLRTDTEYVHTLSKFFISREQRLRAEGGA